MEAIARVNWGRWLADCPRPFCANAEHFGANRAGHVGGLTPRGFTCSECGLQCPVQWPPNVDDITFILGLRPVPATRNWQPPETIHDLFAENLKHGIMPPTERGAMVGDHITDRVLTYTPRLGIGA